MKLAQPTTIDGEIFTHVNINLAITYRTTSPEDGDATVAMRIVPVRFAEDGAMIVSEEKAIGKMLGSLGEAGPQAGNCAAVVFKAIEDWINGSGVLG